MTRTSNIQGLFMQINGGEMQIFIVLVESRFVNLFIPAINLLEVFSQTMLRPAHTQLGHARIPAGREYYAMFCESFCHLFHCFVFLSLHKTLEQTMFVIKVIHKVWYLRKNEQNMSAPVLWAQWNVLPAPATAAIHCGGPRLVGAMTFTANYFI